MRTWSRSWVRRGRGAAFALGLLLGAGVGAAQPAAPPLSIEALRALPKTTALQIVGSVPGGEGFDAYLVAYRSGGLLVHALVAEPRQKPPPLGFPVLVANHGFHPNPPRYGITAEGRDHRPGDYYRAVPAAYAAAGFLVVMPDYRGHNKSEGLEYTRGLLASAYYSEDVVTLLGALASLRHADAGNVFMWGHSMGGEVTLRALLASDRVKAASLWSSVGGDLWDQAYYYSRYENLAAPDGSEVPKKAFDRLRQDVREAGPGFDLTAREPLAQLDRLKTPLVIQHAIGDEGADYRWSMRLAKELYLRGLPYVFHSVPGKSHFFTGDELKAAVDRDLRFFRGLMAAGR